jgi:NADH dehydrogenase/NADH:ubiquinone oxidoreductase subunit G
LPSALHTEDVGTFLNLEGRARFYKKAVTPFKYIFSMVDILLGFFLARVRYLSNNLSKVFNFY